VHLLDAASVKSQALALGADAVGIAPAAPATNTELFARWLASGYAGEMTYLDKYQELRADPRRLLDGAQSVIVVGLNYFPTESDRAQAKSPYKVAKYAWGEDYHTVLRRLLRRLRTWIGSQGVATRGRICVDTAPFPDKYWAQRAGIGWQGKHTNLVSRTYGSWLLIGSLITDASVDRYDTPHLDFCGSCTACLDCCPTDAFPQPRVLDATRCISYWTIESKAPDIPLGIAAGMEQWVFGCDICLDICPWNRFQQARTEPALSRTLALDQIETGVLSEVSKSDFAALYGNSPLSRPGHAGLVRNIRAATHK